MKLIAVQDCNCDASPVQIEYVCAEDPGPNPVVVTPVGTSKGDPETSYNGTTTR